MGKKILNIFKLNKYYLFRKLIFKEKKEKKSLFESSKRSNFVRTKFNYFFFENSKFVPDNIVLRFEKEIIKILILILLTLFIFYC